MTNLHRMSETDLSPEDLAEIACELITRRLTEHEECTQRLSEYYQALSLAAQIIDFATDRSINPSGFEGQIKQMVRIHQSWIEAQRKRGLFPAFPGTKTPVARPRRKRK